MFVQSGPQVLSETYKVFKDQKIIITQHNLFFKSRKQIRTGYKYMQLILSELSTKQQ